MDTKNDPISYARLPFWNLELSAEGYSRAMVCRIQTDKQTFSEAIRHHYNAGNYAILRLPPIGKLCAIVYHKTMANRLISLDRSGHQV